MRQLRFTLPIIILLVFLGSCSDSVDPQQPPTHIGTLSGVVLDLNTGLPLAGTTVILVTEELVIIRAMSTAADGAFFFEGLSTDPILMYGIRENYTMAEAVSSRFPMPEGQAWTASFSMMEWTEEGYNHHITGRVTNATTGDPVSGAWIANTSLAEAGNSLRYLVENTGIIIDVSDENGLYSLPVYGVPEYYGGPVIGYSPISVGCEGYISRTFAGEGPDFAYEPYSPGGLLPASVDSVLVLDMALEPIPAGGLPPEATGTVRGFVVHNDQPQSGVLVNLTLMVLADRDTVFDSADKVSFSGGAVVSGDDGSFEFEVQPGFYALRAGLLPDDGWNASGVPDLEVVAQEITELGNIYLRENIAPTSPEPGSEVDGFWPTLTWTPIEGAESYRISAGFNSFHMMNYGITSETQWSWPAEMPIPSETTLVRWNVYASRQIDGSMQQISWFEVPASFTITAGK